MREKFNEKYENQIRALSDSRIKSKQYKVFDHSARIIGRAKFPELVQQGKTDNENCLIVTNGEGETLVITSEFERQLFNVGRSWLE